ncbi:MAG TPA: CPBP family glutamic-type intramembrane protease [Acidobacteriaceae bacterium]|nr:CPBP family glutamic-type intramembrane protease [Acidobacteriaceae bacterium]
MSFLERLRALGWFLLAAGWFLFSDIIAFRAAAGLSSGEYLEPLYRIFLLFLLICGYSLMSMLTLRRTRPSKAIGLDARPGWKREWALGAAVGWGAVIVCILPAAIIGGLVVTVYTNFQQFWVLVLDLIALIAGTLAMELAFRGYAFQRLVDAMGPAMGTFFMAVIYAMWRTHAAPTSTAVVLFSFLFGWALCLAALRTRALWVSWGVHFAWIAVMSIFFGLPIAGGMNYSPIFATNAVGPAWVTGGVQGPEGSVFGILVGFALLIAVVRVTSDLKYKYGFPEIVPGGIPVDLDATARRQHEAAMAHVEPPSPPLVQIQSAAPSYAASERQPEVVEATVASDAPAAAVTDSNGAQPPAPIPHEEPATSTTEEEPPGPEAT